MGGVPNDWFPHSYLDHLGPLTNNATSPKGYIGLPLVPKYFGHFLWKDAGHLRYGELTICMVECEG